MRDFSTCIFKKHHMVLGAGPKDNSNNGVILSFAMMLREVIGEGKVRDSGNRSLRVEALHEGISQYSTREDRVSPRVDNRLAMATNWCFIDRDSREKTCTWVGADVELNLLQRT